MHYVLEGVIWSVVQNMVISMIVIPIIRAAIFQAWAYARRRLAFSHCPLSPSDEALTTTQTQYIRTAIQNLIQ